MTTDWVTCVVHDFLKPGSCAADVSVPHINLTSRPSAVASKSSQQGERHNREAVVRTEVNEDGAILCNDDDSLCVVNREDSMGEITVVETSRSSLDDSSSDSRDTSVKSHPIERQVASDCGGNSSMQEEDLENEDANSSCTDNEDQFSEVDEPGETEVVYVREGVAVWPTKNERIMGRLSLIKQHQVMFLAWLPYSHGSLNQDGTFQVPAENSNGAAQCAKERTMYAVHPIPLSEVKAIRKHTPSFGWHFIIIILTNGLTLPPLYFSTGGVRALFSTLKQHAFLARSSDDPAVYLVNDTADPLQRSLTSLELSDVLLGAPPPGASCTFAPAPLGSAGGSAGLQVWGEGDYQAKQPLIHSVLEQFHRVTQLARDTTTSLFATSSFMVAAAGDEAGKADGVMGLGSASCLGQPSASFASPGDGVLARTGKAEAELTERRRSCGEATTSVGVFELLDRQGPDVVLGTQRYVRPPPLSLDEWGTFLSAEGCISEEKGLRARVFQSGIEPGLRREAWKFLLGLYPMDSTAAQRATIMDAKRREYEQLRMQWTTISQAQATRFGKWRERRSRVDKDVRRTDRSHPFYSGERNPNLKALRRILLTYSMYNFDLSYCQGMSDLASPLLYVMRDEAEAFWCFAALMDRLESNFHTDCTGMHSQLLALRRLVQVLDPPLHAYLESQDCLNYFFCYRWLLIHFKREFAFDEVLRLWEALWSRHLSDHFHLYACVAVLEHHRRSIMQGQLDFDALLKYCVELGGKIDLDDLLRSAEKLCHYAGEAGAECLAVLPPFVNPPPSAAVQIPASS